MEFKRMEKIITEGKIEKKLNQALDCLLEADSYLLKNDVNERSISHRLAMYLQLFFPDWDVDCEYNRDGNDIKTLKIPSESNNWNDTDAKTVYPDIIIHHRGKADNLLAIEIKKTTSTINDEFDHVKLQAFKQELHYQHAVALRLKTNADDCGVVGLSFIS
jgi:hypothetical protein